MKTKISDILIELTSQTPVLLCVLAGIMPQWRWGMLAIAAIAFGILLWWKFKKKNIGIICIVAGLLCTLVAVSNVSQRTSSTAAIAELGEDPLRSFFLFDQKAQEAWDTNNIALFEEMATIALKEAVKQGADRIPFAYYDNIWHKLELAKNNGSSTACCNMAYMCANGLGRKRSVDDAVNFCRKAIRMNPSDPIPYILLEDMQIDSSRYSEAYCLLSDWRQRIDAYNRRFNMLAVDYFSFSDTCTYKNLVAAKLRDASFREVLFHDTSSKTWQLIDENVHLLRILALSRKASSHTLFLAAYYCGKNYCDSAVCMYDKFMTSSNDDLAFAAFCAESYSVVPDTVVNVFARGMTPLLFGLSCIDLKYLGNSAGARNIPGIDTVNPYLSSVAYYAAGLKLNRFSFNIQSDTSLIYQSELNTISKKFYHSINKLILVQKTVIGRTKSNKYKYNFIVDIHNDVLTPIYPNTEKKSVWAYFPYDGFRPIWLFFNCYDENHNLDEGNEVMKRIGVRFHEQLTHKPY